MCTDGASGDPLGMDANGARHLRHAIDQQQHWSRAAAVRDGLQPVRDPDVSNLVELDGELRRYRARDGHVYMKQLVNGRWAYFF